MTAEGSAPRTDHPHRGDIGWREAIFGGACAGGVFWAVIIRLTLFRPGPAPAASPAWTWIAIACCTALLVGIALARWGRLAWIRTTGAALAIAPLTGASLLAVAGGAWWLGSVVR